MRRTLWGVAGLVALAVVLAVASGVAVVGVARADADPPAMLAARVQIAAHPDDVAGYDALAAFGARRWDEAIAYVKIGIKRNHELGRRILQAGVRLPAGAALDRRGGSVAEGEHVGAGSRRHLFRLGRGRRQGRRFCDGADTCAMWRSRNRRPSSASSTRRRNARPRLRRRPRCAAGPVAARSRPWRSRTRSPGASRPRRHRR